MKRIIKFLTVILCCVITMVTVACSDSKVKYEFVHDYGNVSSFTIDFEEKTATYKGYPMWSVLMNARNYGKCSGATEECEGTLEITTDYGDAGVFYVFTANTSTHWSISISTSGNRESIRCYINGRSYSFRKS